VTVTDIKSNGLKVYHHFCRMHIWHDDYDELVVHKDTNYRKAISHDEQIFRNVRRVSETRNFVNSK